MDLPDLEPPPNVDDYDSWAIGVMQGMAYSESLVELYSSQLSDMQEQVIDQIDVQEPDEDPPCPECGEQDWGSSPSVDGPICTNCGHVGVEQ